MSVWLPWLYSSPLWLVHPWECPPDGRDVLAHRAAPGPLLRQQPPGAGPRGPVQVLEPREAPSHSCQLV